MIFFLILDAIIYIDVSGCQWRLLPEEYPQVADGLLLFQALGRNGCLF